LTRVFNIQNVENVENFLKTGKVQVEVGALGE
jgi:hypothetical protein